jgi:hypothetical protein
MVHFLKSPTLLGWEDLKVRTFRNKTADIFTLPFAWRRPWRWGWGLQYLPMREEASRRAIWSLAAVSNDNNPNNIAVGTVLPPGCAKTSVGCGHPPPTATNDGTYPEVFNNAIVDGSLGSRPKYISTTTRIAGTIPRAAILNNDVGYNS